MTDLATVAPAFVTMAHRIVWASAATVDSQGRPRSRVLHPFWEWDGEVPEGAGAWVDREQVQWAPGLSPSIRILLLSILDTVAMKTR